ncbi:MAG: hypothetical protein J6V97_09235, partial [Prevotella sp.]|nr:hypothetical protein [Prevotella sp.]
FATLMLKNNEDNSEVIENNRGVTTNVTLQDRTLYKDGSWNTLCLPFNIDNIATSPLANYSGLMTLDVTSTEDDGVTKKTRLDGTTLNLWFANATSIEAGKPYIIKWDGNGTNNLTETDLVFSNVTISNALTEVESNDGYVTFLGSYSPMTFTAADKSILFLGSNDKLYYPQPSTNSTLTIGAQRAYFQLNKGLTCGDSANPGQGGGNNTVRAFNLSFGGEETGVFSATLNDKGQMINDKWYSLDGRKLNGKPTTKGLYINNGKKVVIK